MCVSVRVCVRVCVCVCVRVWCAQAPVRIRNRTWTRIRTGPGAARREKCVTFECSSVIHFMFMFVQTTPFCVFEILEKHIVLL